MATATRYKEIFEYFRHTLPQNDTELNYCNPFELLVAVVLSAQCTDKRVNLVTPGLFAAYPTPEVMARASVEEVFRLISSVSYPNNKARHLVGLARMLCERYNGIVPATREELEALPGVGRKTANVVLALVFGHVALAVDTHVFRVSHRLQLVPKEAKTPRAVEDYLMNHIPSEYIHQAHFYLLYHGRYTCTARAPHCDRCGLTALCPSTNV